MADNLGNILQLGEVLEKRLVQLEDQLEEQINKIVDLSRMGTVLTSMLDLEVILPMVIETALSLVKGEVGAVVLFDQDNQRKIVSWGLNEKVTDNLTTETGDNIYEYVRKTGESAILSDIEFSSRNIEGLAGINISTLLASPLKNEDKIIGAIAVANKEGGEVFSSDDRFALEMLGSFAAVAVVNSKLHLEALQKQKLENELDFAQQVQYTLMPDREKIFDGLEVYTYNAQAAQVGGDFYDIIKIDNDKYLIIVADVSNKGIPAALIMASVRSYIRVIAENLTSLSELANKVNNLMCRDLEKLDGTFVTMFFGLVDISRHKLIAVNAGHPAALLIREGNATELESKGLLLGQFANSTYPEIETELKINDRLFVFTDGIFECVNSHDEMLGLASAKAFLLENRNMPWAQLLSNLKKLLKEYSFDEGRVDDTTLMMIEVKK
jgi:sigma-B regulation protein RsbU (phosphoserine phosphatase)